MEQGPFTRQANKSTFPFTRFLVKQMGLAHILGILSSKRAQSIE